MCARRIASGVPQRFTRDPRWSTRRIAGADHRSVIAPPERNGDLPSYIARAPCLMTMSTQRRPSSPPTASRWRPGSPCPKTV